MFSTNLEGSKVVFCAAEDLVTRIKEGEREEGGGDALLGNSSDATLHLVRFHRWVLGIGLL